MHHIAIAPAHTGLFSFFQLNFYHCSTVRGWLCLEVHPEIELENMDGEENKVPCFLFRVKNGKEWIHGRAELHSANTETSGNQSACQLACYLAGI